MTVERAHRRHRQGHVGAVLAAIVLVMTACGNGTRRSPVDEGSASRASGRRQVAHAAGTADIPADIQRIVALDQPAALNALSLV